MARVVTRNQLARRGLIGLIALAVIGTFIQLRSNGTFGAAPHVTAEVATAGGALRSGSDVKMNGVIIGKVATISRASDGNVDVDMSMVNDDLKDIPKNVVARILPATVFGTTFVDLVVHGTASADHLVAGDKVEADKTQGTLELQNALDDIDRLVKAISPSELSSAIGSAAQALDGRGGQILSMVRTTNSYLDRLNPKMPKVNSDLQKLAAATTVVNRIAPDMLDATDDFLVTAGTIVDQQAAITALISGGTQLADNARAFLHKNQHNLVRFINGASALLDVLYDNREVGITGAIKENVVLGPTLATLVENGFVRTEGTLRLSAPGFYGAGQRPSYRPTSAGMGALLGGGR